MINQYLESGFEAVSHHDPERVARQVDRLVSIAWERCTEVAARYHREGSLSARDTLSLFEAVSDIQEIEDGLRYFESRTQRDPSLRSRSLEQALSEAVRRVDTMRSELEDLVEG